MMPENDERNYKNLFNKTEKETPVPGFEEVMQFLPRQKKLSPVAATALLVILVSVITGLFLYLPEHRKTTFSETETELFKQKPLVWEWKSPTESLLRSSVSKGISNFELPTDFLSSQIISSQESDNKKTN